MTSTMRWTSSDLERLPYKEGVRYEIIDGELHVSTSPHWNHQSVCLRLTSKLETWSNSSRLGHVNYGVGVIFSEDNDVIPDLVWISNDRLAATLDQAGHLHTAPELVVEVVSKGRANERRDRELKLNLYSNRGVSEYWIVNWRARAIEVYRRPAEELALVETLSSSDQLKTPLLPGFVCSVEEIFQDLFDQR
jgi:Uma2 family endonuclease